MPAKANHYSRNWCFVIQDYDEVDEQNIRDFDYEYIKYVTGTYNGNSYIQGYMYIQLTHRRSSMKLEKDFPRVHWRRQGGSLSETLHLLCEDDEVIYEDGILRSPGKKKVTDLMSVNCDSTAKKLLIEPGPHYVMNKRRIDELLKCVITVRLKKARAESTNQNAGGPVQ